MSTIAAERLCEPDTPEWLEKRNTGIGSSEAAGAVGLSEHTTPLDIYSRKLNLVPPVEENKAMRRGKRMEQFVVEDFVEVSGVPVAAYPMGMYRHPKESFVLATPDALMANGELLECKTTNWRMAAKFGYEGTDDVPTEYVCQAQQQLAVTGLLVCHVAVLIDCETLRTFRVERSDRLISSMIEAERELWERIQNHDPPEPNWEHRSTPQLIRDVCGAFDPGKVVTLTDEQRAMWLRRDRLAKLKSRAEKREKEIKARIAFEMGDAEFADLGDGRAVKKSIRVRKSYTVAESRSLYIQAVKFNPTRGISYEYNDE
jgi:putative phage-type endonuclease